MYHSELQDGVCPIRLLLAAFGGLKPFGVEDWGRENNLQLGLEKSDQREH